MIQQLLAITCNAFTESIRQPVFAVLTLTAMLALSLCPSIASYTLEDDNILLVDMGLSTLFVAGLFMATFTATGVLSTEIDNKTVLTVISKPVARPLFIVGKFLGVAGALTVGFWTLAVIFMLAVRHGVLQTVRDPFDGSVLVFGTLAAVCALSVATVSNYMFRWVFTSTLVVALCISMSVAWLLVLVVGKGWTIQSPWVDLNPQLMLAIFLIFQMVLILASTAIAASTRLGQTATLVVCALVMVCGLMNDHLRQTLTQRYFLAGIVSWLTPDLQSLWPGDAFVRGQDLSGQYVWLSTAYTGLYIFALLAVAVGLFQQREIK